jgi:arylsulfatase
MSAEDLKFILHRRGFDKYFGLIDGAGSYFERRPYRINQQAPRWMLGDEDFNPPHSGFYLTDAITDHAISFIDGEDEKEEPFFLYLAYTAPHWPLHALPEDIAKYRAPTWKAGMFSDRRDTGRCLRQVSLMNQ